MVACINPISDGLSSRDPVLGRQVGRRPSLAKGKVITAILHNTEVVLSEQGAPPSQMGCIIITLLFPPLFRADIELIVLYA